jgi:hypothetical protein
MRFDEHGHVVWGPRELYELAKSNPLRLVNGYLMTGTPRAFATYEHYCDFLEALSERTGVHPRNMYLRGSCQIGFSIAPKPSAWTAMRDEPDPSDLDLVIVDEAYFTRIEREVQWWEDRNPVHYLQGGLARTFERRQQDRQFNCCRDDFLPVAVCVHHQDTMRRVAEMQHCGMQRALSAFAYPDWLSARRRYEYDIQELIKGVEQGYLPRPGDEPFAARSATSPQAPAANLSPDGTSTS